MTDYLLAHDIGTTGDKATLFSARGRVLASAFAPYPTRHPHVGWAEQDPDDWWTAVASTTRELLSKQPDAAHTIAAIGVSGMMNGCVLIDREGAVLTPALIHADIRGGAQCARLSCRLDPQVIYQTTGCQLQPYFTLGKLAWIAEQAPDRLQAARWCIQAKDYVVGRLAGIFGHTDPSDASLTGLLDMRRQAWSYEIADSAGVPRRVLPPIRPSTEVVGGVCPAAADQTGLLPGTPVVVGAGDGACATAGAGAVKDGDSYHYLGGTSWVGVVCDRYRPDPQARLSSLCTMTPGQSLLYGTVQSAGASVEWFLDTIGLGATLDDPYAALEKLAAQSPPRSRDLLFLPYLQGERAPLWDTAARGAYIGLSGAHTRADMARAVYEGVAYALGTIMAIYQALGLAPDVVRVLGGGMRSRLWRRILAGVYGRPLRPLRHLTQATSCGAAMAAGVGVGLLPSLSDAAPLFAPTEPDEMPEPELCRVYREGLELFCRLYPALAAHFGRIAHLRGLEA